MEGPKKSPALVVWLGRETNSGCSKIKVFLSSGRFPRCFQCRIINAAGVMGSDRVKMSNGPSAPTRVMTDLNKMKIACQSCRTRKVRCSRDVPSCKDCQICGQSCIYPSKILKPGPKAGSVHKRRRISIQDQGQTQTSTSTSSWAPDATDELAAEYLPLERQPRISSSPPEFGPVERLIRSKHIKTLTELCHNTHESPSTDDSPHLSPSVADSSPNNANLLSDACNELGVSRHGMMDL